MSPELDDIDELLSVAPHADSRRQETHVDKHGRDDLADEWFDVGPREHRIPSATVRTQERRRQRPMVLFVCLTPCRSAAARGRRLQRRVRWPTEPCNELAAAFERTVTIQTLGLSDFTILVDKCFLVPQSSNIANRQRVRLAIDGNEPYEVVIEVTDSQGLSQIIQAPRAFNDA